MNFEDAIAMPGMSADRSVCAPKKGGKVKGLKGIHLEFPCPELAEGAIHSLSTHAFSAFYFFPKFCCAEFLTLPVCPELGMNHEPGLVRGYDFDFDLVELSGIVHHPDLLLAWFGFEPDALLGRGLGQEFAVDEP